MQPMTDPFHYRHGNLFAENMPLQEIIQATGTPCFLYSHSAITNQWLAFAKALAPHPHHICYAVKANSNLAVLNTLANLESGFDIVSQGELARVLKAGGNAKQVVFSGTGKQAEEIAFALNADIFCFNVESEHELLLLNQIAGHMNVKARVALRVNPDVDPKSHPYISTGLKESKFGIDIDEAPLLYQKAKTLPHLSIQGVACHIGSQLTTLSPFTDTMKRLLALVDQLTSQGFDIRHLDIGGGLGVRYRDENVPTPQEYVESLLALRPPPNLKLIIEPGRAIVANAGILITKVISHKKSGNKIFCVVDAAMNDFIRPSLYHAWQNILPVKQSDKQPHIVDVVGPVCESGDFFAKDRKLAVDVGEYLAIMGAGAYGFVMSSNYNSRPRACEVYVKDNQFKVVRERETIEDLFAKEHIW
jgi:diaminopimelate decarboxylase